MRGKIGLVPTMGALHEGHLSLVRRAKFKSDLVMATIFVNPKQFGPQEDLKKYPRSERQDLRLLASAGCDLVFIPRSVKEVYAAVGETSILARSDLSSILCGKFRPGHFDGVCTVVYKLFGWIRPHSAFFGEKDFQQLQIIRAMVNDLSIPVRIVGCPIVREKTGLAMSSRNAYLADEDRRVAARIFEVLKNSRTLNSARRELKRQEFKVQYLEKMWGRWLVAVIYKGLRLIDNLKKE